jgi:hypothetical protein
VVKKMDKFKTSIFGWSHIHRLIELLDMSLKDLVNKIFPSKGSTKNLTTSSGKTLNENSKYILREEKKYILIGKSAKLDYQFHVDVEEIEAEEDPQVKIDAEKEA